MQGIVSNDLTPTIELTFVGVNHREETIVAAIDTGFDGALSLPIETIVRLGWQYHVSEDIRLADGSEPRIDIFRGIVLWNGNPRIVSVLATPPPPMLGLALMEGHELRIHVVRGGNVSITERERERPMAQTATSKPIIGLVGGMGSGKSRVAAALAKHGGRIVSADLYGHEALTQPDILARITQRWGDRVIDENGKVDRKKLGAVVFASPVERANLELLVFPWIEKRIREEVAKAQTDPSAPFVVLDAAIMLEAGWNNVCDKIVYVHAPRALRLERLRSQRGWTPDDVARRETAQHPLSVKAARADVAVDNSGSMDDTQIQVDTFLKEWGLQ